MNDTTNPSPAADNEAAAIAAEAAAEAQASPAATDDAFAALEAQLAEAKQDALYARAEIQNVRRRAEKEVADAHAYAATRFARDILSVADNLSRALDSLPPSAREDDAWTPFITGIEATQRELLSVFERNGVKRIEAMGQPLDPNLHQAMMEIPHDEATPGTIVQEIQAGYQIKDRLLRPALVGVAKGG